MMVADSDTTSNTDKPTDRGDRTRISAKVACLRIPPSPPIWGARGGPKGGERSMPMIITLHASLRRHAPRPVRDRLAPRCGWDGGGVPGEGHEARARRRDQGLARI